MNPRQKITLPVLSIVFATTILHAEKPMSHKPMPQMEHKAEPMAKKQAMQKMPMQKTMAAQPMPQKMAQPMKLTAAERKQTMNELKAAINTKNVKGLADPTASLLTDFAASGNPSALNSFNQQVQNSAFPPVVKAVAAQITTRAQEIQAKTGTITPAQLEAFNNALKLAGGGISAPLPI